jgi:hypothetical protein
VNWKRMVPGMAVASVLVMATSFSAPAQVAPAAGPGIPASISSVENTPAIAKEARGWLADLIKINTSNPPGNEQIAAMYIAGILAKDGIKADVLDLAPGRSAVVARLRSAAMADPSKALLLVAHTDTVPVEKPRWSVDPFGAVIKDGYLYGRGAIDDKGMLAANLAVFLELKRSRARLNRDVIFLAAADEETGGDASIRMLIAKHWEKFAAGFAINEGGNVFVKNGKVQYIGVQASEKVATNIAVIARGTSGHASQPTKTIPCYTWRRRWRRLETIRRPCTSRRLCGDISRGWRRSRTTKLASGCGQWTRLTAASTPSASFLMLAPCGTRCFETRLRRRY